MASTHITDLAGRIRTETAHPADPVSGDEYFNTSINTWMRYTGNNWLGFQFTTTSTSTSSSTSTTRSTGTGSCKLKPQPVITSISHPSIYTGVEILITRYWVRWMSGFGSYSSC